MQCSYPSTSSLLFVELQKIDGASYDKASHQPRTKSHPKLAGNLASTLHVG